MNVLMLGQSTKIAKVLSCFCDEITIVVETSLKTSRLSKELKDYHIRKWKCPCCKEFHDRDINAANNILDKGIEKLFA